MRFEKQNKTNVWVWTHSNNRSNLDPDLKNIIFVLEGLRKRVLTWYNEVLNYPGASRVYSATSQYLTCPVLEADEDIWVKTCTTCQKSETKTNWTYVNVLYHKPELLPHGTTNVDLVIPCTLFFKNNDDKNLKKTI